MRINARLVTVFTHHFRTLLARNSNAPTITCECLGASNNESMDVVNEAARGARERDCMNRFAVFHECPLCGSSLSSEHAHFRCTSCGWRDSCCD
jgi:hypothetical protein